uniref:Jacalin-type lectin domain-containing protein n=1 Tax=Globisporangium ultimum (strain ATCC 200006 / CBS 805.95 / DAOM BR144) TaxID=431595 RepID=K3WAX8_GLOUD
MYSATHEDEEIPQEDDEDLSSSDDKVSKEIQPPGMKRRQRLKELHYFVEKQLQKRLYKSWDTIEIAFTSSGDLTVSQIVKFLQLSDVQLSTADAAKVQNILEKHAQDVQAVQAAEQLEAELANGEIISEPGRSIVHTISKPGKSTALSYEAFRNIFHTNDNQEAVKWKREFDREKIRQRREKEIYEKELAALEEKVKKRLAESAKHMIEILAQFRCNPIAIPWENNGQRLELRAQLFETIFTKPQRRHLPQQQTMSLTAPDSSVPASTSVVPDKLNVKLVESALLQKYSRNGHFEAIEVVPAAYIYHDFVADCIKKSVQDYWKRCESDLWPERQMIFRFRLKKQVFQEWRRFTKHAEILRQFVMRKFVAWKYFTRKLHEHYEFIRISFWPFYVWKRHLQQQIIARGKSAFLKNVVLTYIQLRHFRAFKVRYQRKQWNKRHVARLVKKKSNQALLLCWAAWKARIQSRVTIHRLWKSRGHVLQHLHRLYMVKVTFFLWRYFAILKRDLERRRFKCLGDLKTKSKAIHGQQQPNWSGYSQAPRKQHGASRYPFVTGSSGQHLPASASVPRMLAKTGEMVSFRGIDLSIPAGQIDGSVTDDDDFDAELDDGVESNDRSFSSTSSSGTSNVPSLTRIMETDLGQNIKRKSRLYDLCLALYLKCREQDRRKMVENVIIFRRIGRRFLSSLKKQVNHGKKNRLASDLGGFRVLHQRFRQWMIGTLFKDHLANRDDKIEAPTEDNDLREDTTGRAVLHWRRDREWRQIGIEQNPIRAQQLRQDLLNILANDSRRTDEIYEREMTLKRKQQSEDSFLRKETGATLKVKSTQMQQSQQILRTRGHRMHDVLDRVFDDLLQQKMRYQLRSSFRSLRVVVVMKYTAMLCRRAQLRNWLRLCNRFIYWEKHMQSLYRLKLKYHVFQTLLKHAIWKWKFQTPGLSLKLQQRCALINKYEHFLEKCNLLDGSLASSRLALTRYSPANSFHGVFFRWVQYTQFAHANRIIVRLARQKKEIWMLQSVFHVLKYFVKQKYTFELRNHQQPFLLRQSVADLDAYHCKIIALKAQLPTTQLKTKLAIKREILLQAATGSPTLKQLFQEHEDEVRRRLHLENRLMFGAYSDRKIHNYAERSSPLFGASVGRVFVYEKAPPYGSISDIAVICGKKVDGISLVVKTNASMSYEGALHGNPFGTRDVFSLSRGEALISIEGFASQTLYGLRFGTSSGRLSKWYGLCDKGTKFDIRSEYAAKREEIVGLFGYVDGTSVHALGAVFRHTTFKNIFEGLWLQSDHPQQQQGGSGPQRSGSDEVSLCDRQFSYFLQVRTCDVLTAMKRAHRLALRAQRMTFLPSSLTRTRILMGIMRWFFNSLSHGLVHNTTREEEGKLILQDGMNQRASGEKNLQEGLRAMEFVDSFRDDDHQLNTATLGAKKVAELREMLEQTQHKITLGKKLIDDGQAAILVGRSILPHLPMTRRMMSAIREMYKVVQTKDYIDQMDPDVRAILLVGDDGVQQDALLSASIDMD